MKRNLFFICLIFWPITVFGAEFSGEQLLQRSQTAYASLTSYIGTATVNSAHVMNGALFTQSAIAKVTFLSPDRIRIEGKDSGGRAFVIISDAGAAWVSWEFKNRGAFEQAENLEAAVASMTGVASGAPTIIPAALMKLKWGFPFAPLGSASAVARENISGIDCYKVSVSQPERKITYWVDTRSYLLRQMKDEQDEKQNVEMQKMIERQMGEALKQAGIPLSAVAITSMEVTHSFIIEGINVPIDPELFRDPTRN